MSSQHHNDSEPEFSNFHVEVRIIKLYDVCPQDVNTTGELELKAPPQSKLASTFGEDFKKNNIGGSNSRQFAKKITSQ